MPLSTLLTLILVVIIASGVTIWLFWMTGFLGMAVALPLVLIASITLRSVWK